MLNTKSLILLGSTGFLGTAVLNLLKSDPIADLDVLISQSTPPNAPMSFTLLEPDFRYGHKLESTNLARALNSDLVIINCASSRNSKNEELSVQGNFTFPKQVLEKLLAINELRIRWIQIETFWQYSESLNQDASYVFWKNQFGHLLTKNSNNENLVVNKVVLPHLIGPFDGIDRFLPRLFSTILKGERLHITSPDEVFCIADVRNVAQYLVSGLSHKFSDQDSHSVLFPFTEIQLREIVYRFMRISVNRSQVEFLETSDNSNPILRLSEQPPLLTTVQQSFHSLDTTFSDIARWLSELQHIDNLS